MATREETVKICDQCAKEQRARTDGGGYYGGHPLQGWIRVLEHGGSTQLSELNRKKDFDFCSLGCLSDWLRDMQKLRNC